MSGNVRKRKFKRLLREETRLPAEISEKIAWGGKAHLRGSNRSNWSELETNDSLSIDSFEYPSRESFPERSCALKDDDINEDFTRTSEKTRAWAVDDSYSIRRSPGFDGRVQRYHRWSPRNDLRQLCRGRSRSRSWSHSWSRSRSPVYDFKRDYGWSDRSRSGSRVLSQPCRDFTAGRCSRRSKSWFLYQDNLRNRDVGYSEIDPAESWGSRKEYRGASRYANSEGYRKYERDKASHGYGYFDDGERNETLGNNSRSANHGNDFLKSKIHRGSSSRYIHHGASNDGYNRSNRTATFDHDCKREPHRSSDTLCKYFAMGKCRNGDYCRFSHHGSTPSNPKGRSRNDRWDHELDDDNDLQSDPKWNDTTVLLDIAKPTGWGNGNIGNMNFTDTMCKYFAMGKCRNGDYCRFSHDGSTHSNPKGRLHNDRWDHYLDDENKLRSDPKWNDTTAASDIAKSTWWGNGNIGNMNFTDATAAENSTYNRWDDSFDNENRSSCGPVWEDKAAESGKHQPSHWGSRNRGANMVIPESTIATKLSVKEEPPLIPRGSQFETPNGISVPSLEQEASSVQLAATIVHPTVLESSCVQQHKRENNNAITACSNSHNDVNFSGNIMHTVLVPGQSFKHDGDSLGSQPLSSVDETNQCQGILSLKPSNEHTFDLNGPVQQMISPLNLQSRIQFCQGDSVETPAIVESEIPRLTSGTPQNEVNREQVTQVTNLSESLAQEFGNVQQLPHLYVAVTPPSSIGSGPSIPNSESLSPPVDSKAVQLDLSTWSRDQYESVGDSIDSSMPANGKQLPAFWSNPIDRQNQVPLGPNSSEFNKIDISGGGHNASLKLKQEEPIASLKLKQEEPIASSETKKNSRTVPEECKQEKEIGHSENVDEDGRVEEGNRNKDEKGTLIFKIALVEFVKEILKPTWKEGRISKEIHNTVVRKVVDKVIGTIQGVHIPKTNENIDHYLSYSKSKITKLVQAYVEIYPKSRSDA